MEHLISLSSIVFVFVTGAGVLMNQACAVERLKEYCDFEDFEADFEKIEDSRIEEDWPQKGGVILENVSVRYRGGLPLVLRNPDLEIKGGEKVAILGRTGSGKSTLILTLMRILEVSEKDEEGRADKGVITIDGVDISSLGLRKLRKSISVIPQDPMLIEGTVRSNLGELGYYADSQMIEVLKKVGFDSTIKIEAQEGDDNLSSTTEKQNVNPFLNEKRSLLDMEIETNGQNLSFGQRQLVYIARALLEQSRILLMDEATASIDKNLDRKIQHLINKMEGVTIITVAHRLETVLGYDKIIVLDEGRKVEEGSVRELYALNSIFYGMMQEAGINLNKA